MKQIYLQSFFRSGYHRFMNYIYNISNHPKKQEIEKRLEIIKFFDEFGQEATDRAFAKSRSTIFLWKQKIKRSGGKLSALAPGDKAPKTRAKRKLTDKTVAFIKEYRIAHPGADQVTIKPALDVFCLQDNLPCICEATIANVIRRLKEKGELPDYYIRTTLDGKTGKLRFHKTSKSKKKKLRIGKYIPKDPGDLVQIDAITFFLMGTKRYIITAIDIKTRFAFAYSYKTLSSASAQDFIQKLEIVAPFEIKAIQTDNGSEFLKLADQKMQERGIVHFFTYPRSPKSNAFIERFNRTIQDEFINSHEQTLFANTNVFNHQLMDYLLFYNTKRIHSRISGQVPMDYIIKKSNMYATDADT